MAQVVTALREEQGGKCSFCLRELAEIFSFVLVVPVSAFLLDFQPSLEYELFHPSHGVSARVL